jgi:prepilin-type N-terminal cleavage/methylation domain-containing protein
MNSPEQLTRPARKARRFLGGFSLVEMMACVSIIGIIAFLAIPSVSRMRSDSERNLAIARAESLNLAQASFIQVRGRTQAAADWTAAASSTAKYNLLLPYLSYAESTVTAFMPAGYTVTFPTSILAMTKVSLRDPSNSTILY